MIFKVSMVRAFRSRLSLVFGFLLTTGWLLHSLIATIILLWRYNEIAGWNRSEIMVLYCVWGLINGVVVFFFWPSLTQLSNKIVDGDLDLILTKPVNEIFLSSMNYFGFHNLLNGIMYLVIMFFFLPKVGIVEVLLFVVLCVMGMVMHYFLWLIMVTFSFKFGRLMGTFDLVAVFRSSGRFPPEAYSKVPLVYLVLFVPFVVYSAVPASILVGRSDWRWITVFMFCFVIEVVFGMWFWKRSVKEYSSASS